MKPAQHHARVPFEVPIPPVLGAARSHPVSMRCRRRSRAGVPDPLHRWTTKKDTATTTKERPIFAALARVAPRGVVLLRTTLHRFGHCVRVGSPVAAVPELAAKEEHPRQGRVPLFGVGSDSKRLRNDVAHVPGDGSILLPASLGAMRLCLARTDRTDPRKKITTTASRSGRRAHEDGCHDASRRPAVSTAVGE
jgi:hypothetical protein